MQLTKDKKLEVQEMAARTLAGLLKGLSEPAFNALRSDLLHQAQQLFPHRRQKKKAGKLGLSCREAICQSEEAQQNLRISKSASTVH